MSTADIDHVRAGVGALHLPPGRPRLRHEYLAAALAAVTTLWLLDGDVGSRTQRPAAAQPSPLPDPQVLARSLAVHRRSRRTWLVAVVVCAAAGASVVSAAPSIAVVLGVLSLFALHRLRRERRSVAVLEGLRAASLPRLERAA